jgi:hypothetical protein
MINDFLVLDIDSLDRNQRRQLINLFKEMKDVEFSSILEQLKTRFASRGELDIALLQVKGYLNEEAAHLLESLYLEILLIICFRAIRDAKTVPMGIAQKPL